MRRLPLLALASLTGGVALLVCGVIIGQGQVFLVVIFPVITGSGPIPLAGTVLVMLGFVLGFLSMARLPTMARDSPSIESAPPSSSAPPQQSPPRRFGGVVFLGPLPIILGSDVRMSKYMLVVAVALTIILIGFFLLLWSRP